MSKRQQSEQSSFQPHKRLRIDDSPDEMADLFEQLSLSARGTIYAKSSIEISDFNKMTKLRDDYKKVVFDIRTFPEINKGKASPEDFKLLIETLKLDCLRIGISNVNIESIFLQVMDALLNLDYAKMVDRLFNIEYFTRSEYAYKQTLLFSDQFYINKKVFNKNEPFKPIFLVLLDDNQIHRKECNTQIRQLIACMAHIAMKSQTFCENILTRRLQSNSNEPDETISVIELLQKITNYCIKDTRFIPRNLGFITALTQLLLSLTMYYGAYPISMIKIMDKEFEILFSLILRLVPYDIQIMLSLSESFVNIAKYSDRLDLLRNMCINHSTFGQDYSVMFRLHQIEACGCRFHMFFILITHVFRFYQSEPIVGESLNWLIQLTNNFNFLAFVVLANDCDIEFLMPSEDIVCNCYKYFLISCLVLNNIVLKNQDADPICCKRIIAMVRNSVILINNVLTYTEETSVQWYIKFSTMNEMYSWMNYKGIAWYNELGTTKFYDSFENFNSFRFHKYFIEKFDVKPLVKMDRNIQPEKDYKRNQPPKNTKNPSVIMPKDEIIQQLRSDFNSDETFMFGYDRDLTSREFSINRRPK